jgi:hypothetical protein
MVSGGVVWNLDIGAGKMYGFDVNNSQQLYALGLSGSAVHFQSASSGAGHLFVPAGRVLNAFLLNRPGATPTPTRTPTPTFTPTPRAATSTPTPTVHAFSGFGTPVPSASQ